MAARAIGASLVGIDAYPVDVETLVLSALKRFSIVGLPDGVLREAKDRVRCAIENSGLEFPLGEVIVSLAPASLPKHGSGFDFAIALSILAAGGVIRSESLRRYLVFGELALDGRVKPVAGALAAASLAKSQRLQLLAAPENAGEASWIAGVTAVEAPSLLEAVSVLNGMIPPSIRRNTARSTQGIVYRGPDFSDVIGQRAAKRALEVTAAGGHNVLMVGPPGSGKSMLAQRIASILPPLEPEEALEVQKIYSLTHGSAPLNNGWKSSLLEHPERPFRAPHHSSSLAGLIGGGSNPLPGEISLAHKGVLFLDEFAELKRDVLESLREPLETKQVQISRAKLRVRFPADFILVAAMNPCPCGRRNPELPPQADGCKCALPDVRRYTSRVSGPIADRIDLHIVVSAIPISELAAAQSEDATPEIRARVLRARQIQGERFARPGATNAGMSAKEVKRYCALDAAATRLLESAASRYQLTGRSYARVLKVARTLADLAGSEQIRSHDIGEALTYRPAGQ